MISQSSTKDFALSVLLWKDYRNLVRVTGSLQRTGHQSLKAFSAETMEWLAAIVSTPAS
jgi:hypothetical protein